MEVPPERNAEDIGRHDAVDEVTGAAILDGHEPRDLMLLVMARTSGELAFQAARARSSLVATPSVPSTIDAEMAKAAGVAPVERAVSGQPQDHRP